MGATLARREEVRLLAEGSFPLQDRAERPGASQDRTDPNSRAIHLDLSKMSNVSISFKTPESRERMFFG